MRDNLSYYYYSKLLFLDCRESSILEYYGIYYDIQRGAWWLCVEIQNYMKLVMFKKNGRKTQTDMDIVKKK
jgi:hypothetical protein